MGGLRCIVTPTDFSAGADRAVKRAANLPLAPNGRVHIVHVMPRRASEASKAELRGALDKVVARVSGRKGAARKPASVVGRLLTGEPHVEIIRYARNVDADLVVIGRKGLGKSIKRTLGTTAARVVRMGDAPVLVTGSRSPLVPYKHPLIAAEIDPSVRRIIDLVLQVSDGAAPKKLTLVHAYHVPFEGFISGGAAVRPSTHDLQTKEMAEREFADFLKSLEDMDVDITPVLRKGDARSVIFTEAVRRRVDLIALGTHGKSGLARALLGSVAEWVVDNVPQDVLIARPVRFTFQMP